MVKRFEVYLVNLDLHHSKDAKNTRPCLVISPDEINQNLETVIIAPLSATKVKYPTRVAVDFLNNERFVILDQIMTVDKIRLVKKIGEISEPAAKKTLEIMSEMFAE